MNLKKIYGCLTGVATLSALLVSCNTSEAGIKVAPEVQKVVPDSCGKIALDLDLEVPSGYVSPRSRLIVVPQLCDSSLSKPQHYPKNTVFYSVNHSVIG